MKALLEDYNVLYNLTVSKYLGKKSEKGTA